MTTEMHLKHTLPRSDQIHGPPSLSEKPLTATSPGTSQTSDTERISSIGRTTPKERQEMASLLSPPLSSLVFSPSPSFSPLSLQEVNKKYPETKASLLC